MTIQEALAVYRNTFAGAAFYFAPVQTYLLNLAELRTHGGTEISIEVSRGTRTLAADVLRGSRGQRNEAGSTTLRMYTPPYFDEYLDMTELSGYDRMFGEVSPSPSAMSAGALDAFIEATGEKSGVLVNKIRRSMILQVAQILTQRKVVLKNGDDISYPARSGSVITPTKTWDDKAAAPLDDFAKAAEFIVGTGLSGSPVFNVLFSAQAWGDFLKAPDVKKAGDWQKITLLHIGLPEQTASGAVLHGEFAAGSYLFRAWTYPDSYEAADGTNTPFLPAGTVCVLPDSGLELYRHHAGIAQAILNDEGLPVGFPAQQAEFLIEETLDPIKKTHELHVKSAPLVVPWMIDRIANIKTRSNTLVPA